MATFIFANNIDTTLAGGISSASTSLTLSSTQNLPSSIPAGTYLVLTLNDQATRTNYEIVYVTAISGATLTVLRGQEGTAAKAWITGDYAFSGPTAGQMANFMQGAATGVTPGTYGNSTTVPQITVNAQGLVSGITNVAIAFPITSFNGRAGAIVLNSGDVTTALGFNPVNKAGDTMTGALTVQSTFTANGIIGSFSGTVGTQQILYRGGWSNGIARWDQVIEADATYSFYSYNSSGAAIANTLRMGQNGDMVLSGTLHATSLMSGPNATSNYPLDVDTSVGRVLIRNSGGGSPNIDAVNAANSAYVTMNSTSPWTFQSNSTSALYVTNGGNFRLGSTSGLSKYLRTNPSSAALEFVNNAYNAVIAWLGDDGTWNSVAGANFFASDESLKYAIDREAIERPLHRAAPWATYKWKRDDQAGFGPIAQDVQKIAPEYVRAETDIEGTSFLMLDKPAVTMEIAYWAAGAVDALAARVRALELRGG